MYVLALSDYKQIGCIVLCSVFFNRGGLKAQWSTQPRAAPWVYDAQRWRPERAKALIINAYCRAFALSGRH